MRTLTSVPASSATRIAVVAGKLSLLAAIAGLGACSNFDALRSPVFTGSTTNQQQVLAGGGGTQSPLGNTYLGPQGGGVQGADLPPPPGSAPSPAYASAAPTYQQPQAYAPPQPYTPPSSQPMQVASAEPRQLGAPPTTLGEQAVRISGPSAGGAGGSYVVQSGDTAWNISQRHGISVDQLAAANGGSTTVRLGQRLVIPGANTPQQGVQLASLNPQDIPAPQQAAPVPQVPAAAAMQPQPSAPAPQQVALAPQTGNAGSLAPIAPAPSAGAEQSTSGFRWPVRGRIISGFGKKADGERNDGINLAVPEGTAVKAAEDGTVIYAGNELKSYGNLVLIRHSNGWVSAYAHNSALQVKRGDTVRRGQVVALSGMSGGVTTPQVHFELRKDATPVDPLQHLTES